MKRVKKKGKERLIAIIYRFFFDGYKEYEKIEMNEWICKIGREREKKKRRLK